MIISVATSMILPTTAQRGGRRLLLQPSYSRSCSAAPTAAPTAEAEAVANAVDAVIVAAILDM